MGGRQAENRLHSIKAVLVATARCLKQVLR